MPARLVLPAAVLAAAVLVLTGCGGPPPAPPLSALPDPGLLPVVLAPAVPDEAPPPPAPLLRAAEAAAATTAAEQTRAAAATGTAASGTRAATGGETRAAGPPAAAGRTVEAGNPGGGAAVPAAGRPVDTSNPDRVVGDGTPASCTSAAVVAAVAAGGVITFSCGPAPVTIRMQQTAQVDNRSARVVIDGGGLVTLSGGGERRILYQNTCDAEIGFTTSHCQDQEQPHLVLQDIGLADGNASGSGTEGGGAVFARGGQLTVIGSRFTGNRCHPVGQDLGGAAIRVFDQYQDRAVVVSDSTFEGGSCANGGALSSIGVSWTIRNSVFRDNEATGEGANPARAGTPGGGSGGAIYCDGNQFVLDVAGTVIEDNSAREGGGAIFFVSNDRTGELRVDGSTTLRRNPSAGFETEGRPGIFVLDRTTG